MQIAPPRGGPLISTCRCRSRQVSPARDLRTKAALEWNLVRLKTRRCLWEVFANKSQAKARFVDFAVRYSFLTFRTRLHCRLPKRKTMKPISTNWISAKPRAPASRRRRDR